MGRKDKAKAWKAKRREAVAKQRAADAVLRLVPGRKCGECTACCRVVGVTELGKAPYTRCDHAWDQGPGVVPGCAIYEERPGGCRGFKCGWLDGLLAEADRPDRLGLILDGNRDGTMVQAWEVWEGAADAARGRDVVEWLRGLLPVVILREPGSPRGQRTLLTVRGKVLE